MVSEARQGRPASTPLPARQDPHAAQRPALRLLQAWLRGIGDDTVLALPGDVTPPARATPAASASARTSTRWDAAQPPRAAHADTRPAAAADPAHAPSSASPAPQSLRVPATARHDPPPDTVGVAVSPDADADPASPETSRVPPRMPPRMRSDARHDVIDAAPTAIGGIGFLLNALERIGYAQWREAQPAWSRRPILARVFARALHAVDAPAHDPAWALAQGIAVAGEAPRCFVAPECWRQGLVARGGAGWRHVSADVLAWTDASHRLVLAARWGGGASDEATALPEPARALPIAAVPAAPIMAIALDDPDHVVANAWSIALHRWLRRHARIGLVDLLRRPAWLSLTPTHLDLCFDPAQADLRVRRAGLDIDPGWLPWWERVVGFHYERRYGIGTPADGAAPWA